MVRGVCINTAALPTVIAVLLLGVCEHGGTTDAALATACAHRATTVLSLQLWFDLNKRHANLAPGGRRKPPGVAGRWRAVGGIATPHRLLRVVQQPGSIRAAQVLQMFGVEAEERECERVRGCGVSRGGRVPIEVAGETIELDGSLGDWVPATRLTPRVFEEARVRGCIALPGMYLCHCSCKTGPLGPA
jgi:hypothetical protein